MKPTPHSPTPRPLRIVVKMGGNVVQDMAQVATVAEELKVLLAAGHSVCLVHGAGPQLDAAISALGEPIQKIDGLRVTSVAASDVVRNVMETIGTQLAAQLVLHGIATAHVGQAWEAFPSRVKDPRLQRVGTVERFVAPEPWPGGVAVVTPIGYDSQGVLNVNADEGAAAVAAVWQADWLVLATDVAAVRGASGEALSQLTPQQALALVGAAATGGMVPKLGNAVHAISAGVGKVLITRLEPGRLSDAILHGRVHGTLVAAVGP